MWQQLEEEGEWKIYSISNDIFNVLTHIEIFIEIWENNEAINNTLSEDSDYIIENNNIKFRKNLNIEANTRIAIEYTYITQWSNTYYHFLTFGTRTEDAQIGNYSISLGVNNIASGHYSTAIGRQTTASALTAYAEGEGTIASAAGAHAEGVLTKARGPGAHTEGYNTIASNVYTHAEGANTTASGSNSHAEGSYTIASGNYSHAEGMGTTASGATSHAQNLETIAGVDYQTVIGKYNIAEDNSSEIKHAFIIGNGTDDTHRNNALTVDWNGNITCKAVLQTVEDVTNLFNISITSYSSRDMTLKKVFKYGDMIYVWMQASRAKDWGTGSSTNGRFFCKLEGPYLPLLTTPIFTPLGTSAVRGYILGKYGDPTTTAIGIDSTTYNIFLVPSATIDNSSAMINIYFSYLAANYTEPTNPEGE